MQNNELGDALRERLNVLEALWQQKDAAAIVDELYTHDTEITGAGTTHLYSGSGALRDLVATLVTDTHAARIRIDRLRRLAENVAYTWVTWELQTDEPAPFHMKSLFVWTLEAQGWRIIADMYADGVISA
ncbi:DUF4440 domain-containing protein [Pseudomonas abieticivorans]|uniref:DUF4440 domain-containing protein n=1 Tax=Pseudomonas abieticivorans TaxID=2931382 RepID=UPI0020C0689E|nr:DUF4440 domain-containing protein [Pseudomonas sp. PIA16]